MSVHRLEATQVLPIGLDEAWSFLSDTHNLPVITPPWLRLTITSPLPERMYEGLIVSYTVRPVLNIPTTWVTEITHVAEGKYFIDEQRLGPYRFWHHQHHIAPHTAGVEMRDIVHYALPAGPAGDLVAKLAVHGRVKSIFEYRKGVLERRFGSIRHADGPAPAAGGSPLAV